MANDDGKNLEPDWGPGKRAGVDWRRGTAVTLALCGSAAMLLYGAGLDPRLSLLIIPAGAGFLLAARHRERAGAAARETWLHRLMSGKTRIEFQNTPPPQRRAPLFLTVFQFMAAAVLALAWLGLSPILSLALVAAVAVHVIVWKSSGAYRGFWRPLTFPIMAHRARLGFYYLCELAGAGMRFAADNLWLSLAALALISAMALMDMLATAPQPQILEPDAAETDHICPENMVAVPWPEPFCIDRFEFPNIEGETPISGLGPVEAERLCHAAGKRLCYGWEWQAACMGPERTVYSYGDDFIEQACNVTFWEARREPVPSGSMEECKSDWGTGVYDLNGNVWEWTLVGDGTFYGVYGGSHLTSHTDTRCMFYIPFLKGQDFKDFHDYGVRCCL